MKEIGANLGKDFERDKGKKKCWRWERNYLLVQTQLANALRTPRAGRGIAWHSEFLQTKLAHVPGTPWAVKEIAWNSFVVCAIMSIKLTRYCLEAYERTFLTNHHNGIATYLCICCSVPNKFNIIQDSITGYSCMSESGEPISIPEHLRVLSSTKRQWDRYSSEFFGFPLSVCLHPTSTVIFSPINGAISLIWTADSVIKWYTWNWSEIQVVWNTAIRIQWVRIPFFITSFIFHMLHQAK